MTVDVEVARYRTALEEMADLEEVPSSEKWNRLVAANHNSYLVLREAEEGRVAIEALMSHNVQTVRSWAAAHALLWNEAAARPVLEILAAGRSRFAQREVHVDRVRPRSAVALLVTPNCRSAWWTQEVGSGTMRQWPTEP